MRESLFELADKYEQLLINGVDEETGEISPECMAAIEAMEDSLGDKALAVGAYLKGLRAEALAVVHTIADLAQRAKKLEARATRWEAYIQQWLPEGQKASDGRCEIKWSKSQAVLITAPSLIPEEFLRRKPAPPPEPDKNAIAAASKAGRTVPGAFVKKRIRLKVT